MGIFGFSRRLTRLHTQAEREGQKERGRARAAHTRAAPAAAVAATTRQNRQHTTQWRRLRGGVGKSWQVEVSRREAEWLRGVEGGQLGWQTDFTAN